MQNRPQPLTDNNLTGALRLFEVTDAHSVEHSRLLELIVSYFRSNQHEYQKALTAFRLEDRPAVQQYLSRTNFISNYRELTISIVKYGNTKLVNTIVNILKFNVATRIALRKLMCDLLAENTDLSLKTFEYILRNNAEIDLNEKLDTLKSKNQPSSLLSLVVVKLLAEASLSSEDDRLRIFNTTMYLQATLRILRLSFSDEAQHILTDMRNIKSDNPPLYNLAHTIIHIFEKEMDREVKLNGLCEVVADLKLCEQSVAAILPEALLSNIVNKYTQDLNFNAQPPKSILLTHQGFQESLSQFLKTKVDDVDHPILLNQIRDYFKAHHDLYEQAANRQVITHFKKPSGSATADLIQDNYYRFQLSILEATDKNINILIELIPILMSIHQGSELSPQLNRLTLLSFAFDGAPALLLGFKFILRHYAHLNLNQPLRFSEHLNDLTSLSKTICSAALNTFNEYNEGNQSYQQVIQITEFLKASIELDTLAELESSLADISTIYEGKIPPSIITDIYAAAINKVDRLAATTKPQALQTDECQPFVAQSRNHLFQPNLSGSASPNMNDDDQKNLAAKAAAPQQTMLGKIHINNRMTHENFSEALFDIHSSVTLSSAQLEKLKNIAQYLKSHQKQLRSIIEELPDLQKIGLLREPAQVIKNFQLLLRCVSFKTHKELIDLAVDIMDGSPRFHHYIKYLLIGTIKTNLSTIDQFKYLINYTHFDPNLSFYETSLDRSITLCQTMFMMIYINEHELLSAPKNASAIPDNHHLRPYLIALLENPKLDLQIALADAKAFVEDNQFLTASNLINLFDEQIKIRFSYRSKKAELTALHDHPESFFFGLPKGLKKLTLNALFEQEIIGTSLAAREQHPSP